MVDNAQNEEDEDESSDDEDSGAISEIRFVPSDKAARKSGKAQTKSVRNYGKLQLPWVSVRDGGRCNKCVHVCVCACVCAVENMFSAMCECQALHPDPEDEDSDNDFEGEEYDVEEAGG